MLSERFRPDLLYGFDPHPAQENRVVTADGETRVVLERKAAWTYDGVVAYRLPKDRPLSAHVGEGEDQVVCFDLARFLNRQPVKVILKVDIEGGEYELLEHCSAAGALEMVETLLVEWHRQDQWGNRNRKRRILNGFVTEEWR